MDSHSTYNTWPDGRNISPSQKTPPEKLWVTSWARPKETAAWIDPPTRKVSVLVVVVVVVMSLLVHDFIDLRLINAHTHNHTTSIQACRGTVT